MTGATAGLGPSLVEAFLALGAEVLAAGRHRTSLDALRAEMGHHERLEVAECDVTDPAGAERLFDAWTRAGTADVVVHALERVAAGPLEDLADAELARAIDETLLGTAIVLRAALRRMRAGSLVVVAGEPAPEDALDAATFAAVLRLVNTTKADGVRVNAVTPSAADEDARRAVVRAAVWLASDASAGIGGARLSTC